MKRVLKSQIEPPELSDYKKRFVNAPRPPLWKEFNGTPGKKKVKKQLRDDQRGICAYCEITLIPVNESVEHVVARDADHGKELDWSNLLLCCSGGEHPLPEDIEDANVRYDPQDRKTCGHAKLGCRNAALNPLAIPAAPRLFRFKSLTGEIEADESECRDAGIDLRLAQQTVITLNLNAGRLNRARLAVMEELDKELSEADNSVPFSTDRERKLSEEYFPMNGNWPAFFTTIRFELGDGAEQHLASINYQG